MRLLLHICCANCACYTIKFFKNSEINFTGFFFNPNVHPFLEYQNRKSALILLSSLWDFQVIYACNYNINLYFRNIVYSEKERCKNCYHLRLKQTALYAKENNYDSYSTTLLYSKFQKHDLVKEIGYYYARKLGITFYYEDLRKGWHEGILISKQLGLYRQSYCGCIYSEMERYLPKDSDLSDL